jgi:voltage-gated potassium channel
MGRTVLLHKGMRDFAAWLFRLVRQPIFLFVTIWGHAVILLGAAGFFWAETGNNPQVHSFFDSYYWAISMATTVGNAELAPVSTVGKVIAILLMVFGSLFLWSTMALLAASFVAPAVRRAEREVEAEVERVEREVLLDQATMKALLRELEIFNRARKGEP